MEYRQFIFYNVIGGIAWVCSMCLLGYFLGNVIPAKHLDKAVIAIILLSIFPMITHALKERKNGKKNDAAVAAAEGKPFATKSESIKG